MRKTLFRRGIDQPDLEELYNHKEDVHETINLATEEQYSSMLEYCRSKCDSITGRLETQYAHSPL